MAPKAQRFGPRGDGRTAQSRSKWRDWGRVRLTGSARIGDWVEARVDSAKVGKTLAFANAYLTVAGVQIARASAVFAVAGESRS